VLQAQLVFVMCTLRTLPASLTSHACLHTRRHPCSCSSCVCEQVDVDITSNTVANSVTSLVVGAITSLVVDLAPLVEGQVRGRQYAHSPARQYSEGAVDITAGQC
jgi:hypothetical protein